MENLILGGISVLLFIYLVVAMHRPTLPSQADKVAHPNFINAQP
jgi:hypothetical protein